MSMNPWERAKEAAQNLLLNAIADTSGAYDEYRVTFADVDALRAVLRDMERVECVEGAAGRFKRDDLEWWGWTGGDPHEPYGRPALLLLLKETDR